MYCIKLDTAIIIESDIVDLKRDGVLIEKVGLKPRRYWRGRNFVIEGIRRPSGCVPVPLQWSVGPGEFVIIG
jgi:hypothetical protein